ncbi:MAG: efflux RND transporter periplasmic adaptor subunit [Phormidesmis sp.]
MTFQMPKWQDRRLLAAITGLLILNVGGGLYVRSQAQRRQAEAELAAQPLPTQVQVAALGRVEPSGGVVNVASSEQGVVSELRVEAGDRVQQDQVLAYLDIFEVREAERDYAASQLAEAQGVLAAQQQLGSARIAEANTRVDQVDLPESERIRAQEADIRDLQAQLDLAQTDLARFQTLANRGAIAQQQLDSQQAQVTQIQQQIAAARATLSQLESARSANINNATAQVSAAQADLQLSQATAGVQSAAQNLALAEARLEQTIIRAPFSGQIIEVFIDPGESVNEQAVLSMGNTEQMKVVAEVYESDIGLVEVGQNATIRSRNAAFDEVLSGTVSEIALQIFKNDILDDDPAAEADARVVEVDIAVDQPTVIAGLTNLQVDVVIDVDEAAVSKPERDITDDSETVESE